MNTGSYFNHPLYMYRFLSSSIIAPLVRVTCPGKIINIMHISPYIFTSSVMARRENIHSFIAQNHLNAMYSMEKRFRPSRGWTSAETLHLICTTVIFTLYTRTTPPYNSGTHPFRTFVDRSLKSRVNLLPDHGRSGPAILWPVRFALISSQGWFIFDK